MIQRSRQHYDFIFLNGYLIDGTGAEPVRNASLGIRDGRIAEVCTGSQAILERATAERIIELHGAAILPGLIHAHAHTGFKYLNGEPYHGFQKDYLQACIREGITTVRDEGMMIDGSLAEVLAARKELEQTGLYPRIITTGKFFSAPGGYGGQAPIGVSSPEEAEEQVNAVLDLGIDMIKTVLEDGYDPGTIGLPQLSDALLRAICEAAHRRGARVSAHVTASANLQRLVAAGIDDAGHIPFDLMPPSLIEEMVEKDIYIVPTLTVSRYFQDKFGAPLLENAKTNVKRFVEAGGKIALGDDFMEEDQPWYRPGMPHMEMELLREAGLTEMQILLAATKHGAAVCGIAEEAGTIEAGKKADILIVRGNPLEELEALKRVRMVLKEGNPVVCHPIEPAEC